MMLKTPKIQKKIAKWLFVLPLSILLLFSGCSFDEGVVTEEVQNDQVVEGMTEELGEESEDNEPEEVSMDEGSDNIISIDHYPYYSDGKNIYTEIGNLKGESIIEMVENADLTTFRTLDRGYGIDKHRAYFYSKEVQGVDLESFQVLYSGYFSNIDYGYSKDGNNVYFNNMIFEEADANSFETLRSGYSRDKDNVYYPEILDENDAPIIIEGADAGTFTNVEGKAGHFEDKKNTYFRGKIVE